MDRRDTVISELSSEFDCVDTGDVSGEKKCHFTKRPFSCHFAVTLIVWATLGIFVSAQDVVSTSEQSWTATSETMTSNARPFRTTESHVRSGNRILDTKIVEVPGADGRYRLYVQVEVETIQESSTLSRSITRTYNPDSDGRARLTQITEVETLKSDDGARTVQTSSKPDWDGKVNVVEREITETKRRSDSQNTHTTVYLPSINGGLAPTMQVDEKQTRSPNGDISIKDETLLVDTSGQWGVYEVRERTVKEDAHNRTIDDRVSRRDYEGNISPVSEIITRDGNNNGQLTNTREAYSVDVPGSTRDESLHLRESSTTVRTTEPGQITTEQHVVKHDAEEKGSNTMVNSKDVLVQSSSGTKETITVTAQYPDGYPSVVSVESRKSDRGAINPAEGEQ